MALNLQRVLFSPKDFSPPKEGGQRFKTSIFSRWFSLANRVAAQPTGFSW
uniref:Uncharacterized protein n=1 Tax=Candidatus Kentrum eta TaxID=2126337 RepID=A0A450VDM4_9GAMM|nr:MAG: hypothetical protein BECKH772B_GA0070898_103116 [Candidatus Kentron sp. H]VFK06711.1 MAG: hypothetical protein BECKH772C_GA0070978_103694 [Candidatus Kentron sp. H]